MISHERQRLRNLLLTCDGLVEVSDVIGLDTRYFGEVVTVLLGPCLLQEASLLCNGIDLYSLES